MTTPKRDWIEKAACTDMDPGMFFADEPNYDELTALDVCAVCPARNLCLTEALAEEGAAGGRGRYGIRGGMTPGERASLDRKGRRPGARTPQVNELSAMDHMFRKEWHAQGMSDTEIGRLCKVQSTTIQKWREKYGLPPNAGHAHAPAAIIAERFRLAEQGLSNREIADREGANIDAIRSWRKRNGLAS